MNSKLTCMLVGWSFGLENRETTDDFIRTALPFYIVARYPRWFRVICALVVRTEIIVREKREICQTKERERQLFLNVHFCGVHINILSTSKLSASAVIVYVRIFHWIDASPKWSFEILCNKATCPDSWQIITEMRVLYLDPWIIRKTCSLYVIMSRIYKLFHRIPSRQLMGAAT
jgi:hypothetical protein